MPGFKIHISVSTGCGIAIAGGGIVAGLPLVDSLLAGTFCSIGGILPDMDSASGRPSREVFGLLGATVPMMLAKRMTENQWPHDVLVLSAIIMYVFIRFGMARILSRISVHRGMWHSVPSALAAAFTMYLLAECPELNMRIFRALAVLIGYLSHLVMDEIWSINVRTKPHFKSSFGTALKFWSSKYKTSTVFVYVLMIGLFLSTGGQTFLLNKSPRATAFVESVWPSTWAWPESLTRTTQQNDPTSPTTAQADLPYSPIGVPPAAAPMTAVRATTTPVTGSPPTARSPIWGESPRTAAHQPFAETRQQAPEPVQAPRSPGFFHSKNPAIPSGQVRPRPRPPFSILPANESEAPSSGWPQN